MKGVETRGANRLAMPICAAFIDDLRNAFGKEEIDAAIQRGMKDGSFYAREGEIEIGTRRPPKGRTTGVWWNEMNQFMQECEDIKEGKRNVRANIPSDQRRIHLPHAKLGTVKRRTSVVSDERDLFGHVGR